MRGPSVPVHVDGCASNRRVRRQPGAGGLVSVRPRHDAGRCARPVATRAAARAGCVTLSSARSALDVARPGRAPPGAGSRAARQPLRPRQSAARPLPGPDAALRTARAAPIGSRSGPERRYSVPGRAVGQHPSNGPSRPDRRRSPRPGSPAQRLRRGDQRSMACSRCGSTAVQRPSAPCRCPLRAASTCMSASAQPGSRSAARHQRRSAPRCAFAGGSRPAGGPR